MKNSTLKTHKICSYVTAYLLALYYAFLMLGFLIVDDHFMQNNYEIVGMFIIIALTIVNYIFFAPMFSIPFKVTLLFLGILFPFLAHSDCYNNVIYDFYLDFLSFSWHFLIPLIFCYGTMFRYDSFGTKKRIHIGFIFNLIALVLYFLIYDYRSSIEVTWLEAKIFPLMFLSFMLIYFRIVSSLNKK